MDGRISYCHVNGLLVNWGCGNEVEGTRLPTLGVIFVKNPAPYCKFTILK